ncbi:MAG: hypothetical protein ABIR17_12960 [Pseudolysinimonas sp.]|uniref:hypothetical protein n=1 Tax=Pseudolysinimonas sp. TaxID=2680009 RepID=UPI003265D278
MADANGDGVLDEAEGNIRMMLMMAAQSARSAVQRRQDRTQQATRADLEQARFFQAQLDAERATARAELAVVHNSSWWDQANVRDVARVYETAVAWRDEDQPARDAESRIKQELRDRYDIDVNEWGADPSVVAARLEATERARGEQEEQEGLATEERDVATGLALEAEFLELQADQVDEADSEDLRDLAAEVEHDAEVSWDSAQRRGEHAAAIEGPDAPAAAAAWTQADVDNGKHPREAVRGSRTKSSRTKVPTAAPERQPERGR